jgi:hypothetical protein
LGTHVIAEGNETPGDEPPRRGEADLLAERRARRAADSGEPALTRRAEAAEATVHTLEVHVSTLQARLQEIEQERSEHLDQANAERAAVLDRDAELRRVKQREYAEQQLRVEAEERLLDTERDSRAQIAGLNRRLAASEQEARRLAERLEGVQRALAEAEQATAAERTAVRRSERELQARLTELECRTIEMDRALGAERAARERAESVLDSIRRGHRKVEAIVGETRVIVGRLAAAFATEPLAQHAQPPARQGPVAQGPAPAPHVDRPAPHVVRPAPEVPLSAAGAPAPAPEPRPLKPEGPAAPAASPAGRSGEMAEALAAAVERLRARAEEPRAEEAAEPQPPEPSVPPVTRAPRAPMRQPLAAVPPPARQLPHENPPVGFPAPSQPSPPPAISGPRYKHSLSWIGRWRIRRKQRRGR